MRAARAQTEEIAVSEEEPSLSEIEKILSELDLDNLSPMQAFMVLSDLSEKVKR